MRRLPLPGWVLALAVIAFVATWLLAPRRILWGRPRPFTPPPAWRGAGGSPAAQIQPERLAPRELEDPPLVLSHPWQVALTFDDGPHPVHTARLLEILERYRVKATFFVNGCWLASDYRHSAANRAILRRAHRAGHAIGNHTFSHARLIGSPPELQEWEILENERLIQLIVGERPTLFRPPYAALSRHSREILKRQGYTVARWNAAAMEEGDQDPEGIRRAVFLWIRHHEGGIVMLHDRSRQIVDAVELILQSLEQENCKRLARGLPPFRVVPLDSFRRPPAQSIAWEDQEGEARLNRICRE